MASLILDGHDLSTYIPADLSPENKDEIITHSQIVLDAVQRRVLMGLEYEGTVRIVAAHSIFLQNGSPASSTKINHPIKGYPTKMPVYRPGARRTVGMDGYELLARHRQKKGWKSFHIDRIQRILSYVETLDAFNLDSDIIEIASPYTTAGGKVIEFNTNLRERFTVEEDFIGDWNYWDREYIAQVPSKYSLKPRSTK